MGKTYMTFSNHFELLLKDIFPSSDIIGKLSYDINWHIIMCHTAKCFLTFSLFIDVEILI